MTSVSLPDEVRAACAWVAERAGSVQIDRDAIEPYAADLPQTGSQARPPPFADDPEAAAAFAICMDAINFGSGWFSQYDGRRIPFYKRVQLAAADLHRAGVAELPGLERLTAFADNLVPPRPPSRRCPPPRSRPHSPHRSRTAPRARLARGGRAPRLRRPRRRAPSRRQPSHPR